MCLIPKVSYFLGQFIHSHAYSFWAVFQSDLVRKGLCPIAGLLIFESINRAPDSLLSFLRVGLLHYFGSLRWQVKFSLAGEYACQKCGKVFQDMCNARRHLNRVHFKCYDEKVRLKKYSCNFPGCIQRFPCPSKLQDHKTSAHSGKIVLLLK